MRSIITYSTRGAKLETIESDATRLGALKEDMDEAGIDYSGLKLMVSETEVTLESDEAVLPEGEFTLMMLPDEVKSGNSKDWSKMSYIECFNEVKLRKLISEDGLDVNLDFQDLVSILNKSDLEGSDYGVEKKESLEERMDRLEKKVSELSSGPDTSTYAKRAAELGRKR